MSHLELFNHRRNLHRFKYKTGRLVVVEVLLLA
jgi:hypothetical protein